jgi:hypothetical protein
MYQYDRRAIVWCHLTRATDITDRHGAVDKKQLCRAFNNSLDRHAAI